MNIPKKEYDIPLMCGSSRVGKRYIHRHTLLSEVRNIASEALSRAGIQLIEIEVMFENGVLKCVPMVKETAVPDEEIIQIINDAVNKKMKGVRIIDE